MTVTCSEREDLVAHLEAFCGSSKEMPNMVNAKGGLVGRSKDFFSKIDSGSNFEMEFQTASELKKKKKTLVPDKVKTLILGFCLLESTFSYFSYC